ncbi:MAG: HDIG domain-containing protein [Bacteroidales bacterium]|nr:HDIG domain-containing protein [Bacteroidales bacterium]MBR6414799.1 HDIG domain-containing protein [Bacteroidales bacterium]
MTDKERILSIIRSTGREGTEEVIGYLLGSNYFTRQNVSHHKQEGGLARHSLEVYDIMMSGRGKISPDSIAVAALFHDLGKTRKGSGSHGDRAVAILRECGFPLSDDEKTAISTHHGHASTFWTCPLRRLLSFADSVSAGKWHLGRKRKKR